MLSWLPKSSVHSAEHAATNIRYDHLLFELSPNHVSEYFKPLVRVKAEAIMCLDPVLVDDSQTPERFETIRKVFPASNPDSVHQPRNGSLVRTEARRTYTVLEASRPFVLLRVSCSLAARFWSCWIIEQLSLINGATSTVFYLVCPTMLVTGRIRYRNPDESGFSKARTERRTRKSSWLPCFLHPSDKKYTTASQSLKKFP
jgi:hypothetical protein